MNSDLGTVHQCLGSCFGLFEQEIQNHFRSCHGKDSVQRCAAADSKLSISERTEEAHVMGFGGEIDFTATKSRIGEMEQISIGL